MSSAPGLVEQSERQSLMSEQLPVSSYETNKSMESTTTTTTTATTGSPPSQILEIHDHDHDHDNNNNNENSNKSGMDHQYAMHDYKGGAKGHLARRVYHVTIFALIPWLFFWYFQSICDAIGIRISKALSIIILVQIVLEAIRIKKGVIIFGQREYERKQVCAQAWGTISTCVVLMLAYPRAFSIQPAFTDSHNHSDNETYACYAQIALPIIWSLGFGDPLIGELKRYGVSVRTRSAIATFVLMIVYLIAFLWCGTPFWLIFILPPIAVAAEYPKFTFIDDNATMLLIPLLFSLFLEPWFKQKCDQIL